MSDSAGITVSRRRGYTVVYNDLLPSDGSLSARAWGLYVYLLSRPDGWECRAGHLRTVFKEGRDAIYAALRELVTAGLMEKIEYVEDGLRRTRYALDADEQTSRSAPETGFQDPGDQETGDQHPGSPDPEKPGQESKDPSTTDEESKEEPVGATADAAASTAATKRGTRLPDDWYPDEHLKQWFRDQPFARTINPVQETEKFRNYWHSTPGQRGTKLDWPKTWMNWMITASERASGRPPSNVHHLPENAAANQQMIDNFERPAPPPAGATG